MTLKFYTKNDNLKDYIKSLINYSYIKGEIIDIAIDDNNIKYESIENNAYCIILDEIISFNYINDKLKKISINIKDRNTINVYMDDILNLIIMK